MSYVETAQSRESAPRADFLLETLAEQYGPAAARVILRSANPNPFALNQLLLIRGSENQPGGVILGKTGKDFAVWQMLASYPVEVNKVTKQAEGIVVFWDPRAAGGLGPYLEFLIQTVGPEKGVWIFEKAVLDSSAKEVRRETLKSWGLKDRKVVQIGRNVNLWYGRTAKEHRPASVDLTIKPWYRVVRAKMIKEYLAEGWKKVDCRQLDETCRHSRLPLLDLSNLRLGFGVELTAPCGCRWQVNQYGEWERREGCIDPDCDGFPKTTSIEKPKETEKQPYFYVGDNIPSRFTCRYQDRETGYCGERLVFDRRIVGENGQTVEVISNLKCPHHGLMGRQPRIYKIDSSRIRPYSPEKLP